MLLYSSKINFSTTIVKFFGGGAQQPTVGQGFIIVQVLHNAQTHHTRYGSSGRVISPSQRPVPDNTQHSQQTDTHAPGGIRTRNPYKAAAENPRLRPRGHCQQLADIKST
jgi:hypothetical protein